MTVICFKGQFNKITIDTVSKSLKLNDQDYSNNLSFSYISTEKGRASVGEYTIKYSGKTLTLYVNKDVLDVCTRITQKITVDQQNTSRTFYMTSSKFLKFYESDMEVYVDGIIYPISHTSQLGIHVVYATDIGKLSISTTDLFPSMWNGLNLIEHNRI